MTLDEIKSAVESGKTVHWVNTLYRVVKVKGKNSQWLIKCDANQSCIGLTWTDDTTLNGKPDEFFIGK